MDRTSREEWAKRVERWGDSGLTAKEYAAELGIKAHTLSWWKWRLSSESLAKGKGLHARLRRATTDRAAVTPLTFVEMTSAAAPEAFEVVLRSSVRIRVPSTFDGPTLARLLDVLESRG
jgi:hypothetical protein